MGAPKDNADNGDEHLKAPPRLTTALRQISKPTLFIPPTVDEAVLRSARRHFAQPEIARLRAGFFGVPPTGDFGARPPKGGTPNRILKRALRGWFLLRWAAAAILLLLVLVGIGQWLGRPGLRAPGTFAREDLNRDGTVDILDAFALARELKRGDRPGPQQDLNGDGVVDERDVATLAARAVSLQTVRRL